MQNDVEGTVAEPLLASRLVDDAMFEGLFERARGIVGPKGEKRRVLLCTGVKSLDEALQGGLECGRIVGVHAEAGAGGGEVSVILFYLFSCWVLICCANIGYSRKRTD